MLGVGCVGCGVCVCVCVGGCVGVYVYVLGGYFRGGLVERVHIVC